MSTMFAVCPRLSDELDLWPFTEEFTRPFFDIRVPRSLRNAAAAAAALGESEVRKSIHLVLVCNVKCV